MRLVAVTSAACLLLCPEGAHAYTCSGFACCDYKCPKWARLGCEHNARLGRSVPKWWARQQRWADCEAKLSQRYDASIPCSEALGPFQPCGLRERHACGYGLACVAQTITDARCLPICGAHYPQGLADPGLRLYYTAAVSSGCTPGGGESGAHNTQGGYHLSVGAVAVRNGVAAPACAAPVNVAAAQPADTVLTRPDFPAVSALVPGCGCTGAACGDGKVDASGVRAASDLMAGGGAPSPTYTNLLWLWGQWLDHDLVGSVSDPHGGEYDVDMGGALPPLRMQRVRSAECAHGCAAPEQIATPQIDAGTVYSAHEAYTQGTLREPGTCYLRTSAGDFPPVTTAREAGGGEGGAEARHWFLAGDPRANENAALTAMHTVWLREHNRACRLVIYAFRDLDADGQFALARKVTAAKMQEITLFEWLPALGIAPEEVFFWKPRAALAATSAISTEFAINYRWGHTAVPERVGAFPVASLFGGEAFYEVDSAAGAAAPRAANAKLDVLLGAFAATPMADLDGKMADVLRNTLFGHRGMDLASFNIFRARDLGLPGYRALAECYGVQPHGKVATDDPFVGAVQEQALSGQAFGPLLRRIMIDQFHRSLFGAEGNWWEFDGDARLQELSKHIAGTRLHHVLRANTGARVPKQSFLLWKGARSAWGSGGRRGGAWLGVAEGASRGDLRDLDTSFRPKDAAKHG